MKRFEHPEVSIIVHLQTIGRNAEACLQSLSEQTLQACQFIIIHDGKSGDALYFANEFARHDQRFEIHLQMGLGCGEAYNYGFTQIRAPYVTFLTGFDILQTNFCEVMVNQLVTTASDIAICPYNNPIWQGQNQLWLQAGSQLFNKMYRSHFLQQGGYVFPEQVWYADWLVNYQTLAATTLATISEATSVVHTPQPLLKAIPTDHCYDIFPILTEIYDLASAKQEAAVLAIFIEAIFKETLPKFWHANDPTAVKYQTNYCLMFLTKFFPEWREQLVELPSLETLTPLYGRLVKKNLTQLGTWRWRLTWLRFLVGQSVKQIRQ